MNLWSVYGRSPRLLQEAAVSGAGLRNRRLRRGGSFGNTLAMFEMANRSWADTEALQLTGLRRVAVELGLGESGTAADLRARITELPVTTKADVVDDPGRFGRSVGERTSMLSTGGSTGTPLRFPVTRGAVQAQWAVWWRYRRWHGIEPGTWSAQFGGRRVVPDAETQVFWRRNVPERQLQLSTHHLDATTVHRYVEALDRHRIAWIHGLPSTITRLAILMDEAGLRLGHPMAWVTFGSENEPNGCRAVVREVLGVEPRQHYGLAEAAANLSECPLGRLHVDEDFAFVEFLPVDDDPDLHRVVGTALWNPAFRFVRYDTGDLVSGLRASCDCGRPGRTVDRIDGRTASYVELSDGRRVGPVSHLFRGLDGIVAGQVLVGPDDALDIHVVASRTFNEATADELVRRTVTAAGRPIPVVVSERDELVRAANGKVPVVVQSSPRESRADVEPTSRESKPLAGSPVPERPIMLDFSLIAPGGATSHATGFLNALAELEDPGPDLLVALPGDPAKLVDQERALRSRGIEIVRIGGRAGAGSWRSRIAGQLALPLLARRRRPVVVYLAREVAPLTLFCPTVVTATNVLRWGYRPPGRTRRAEAISAVKSAVAERAVRRARAVIAISRSIGDLLPAGVRAEVIPLGIDIERDTTDPRPLSSRRPLRLVTLGTIAVHKRVDLVIDIAVELVERHGLDLRLDLWGPAASEEIAEDIDRRLESLGDRGRRRGPVAPDDRPAMFAEADVLVVGSGTESFGFPMIEAMRTATIVLAPAAPVVRDACGDAAVTYPEGDAAAAAAALVALLGDDDAAERLVADGIERSELFTWSRCVEDTLALLREVGVGSGRR